MYLNFTERLLRDAGIVPGMNVLDIGCGSGEVSFIVSRLVGNSGQVVGVDTNERAIAMAQSRALKQNCANVSFIQTNLTEISTELGSFDAVVGRRILMYLKNPVAVMNNILEAVKPNGLLIFQESDLTIGTQSSVPMPLHDKVFNWIAKAVASEGADINFGLKLGAKMQEAGILVKHIRAEPNIQGQGDHNSLYFTMRNILPRITSKGIASQQEIEIETLERRLLEERVNNHIYIGDVAFGAWGHKPSA